ncbi:MAG TPA: response regulator transcription factor [Acidobacteriota bacterium]
MGKRVLVVEDEPDVQRLIAHHLRQAGLEVSTSGDGEQGWLLAKQMQPDLVILDIMLPGISGWEVCQLIKRHQTLGNIPVIMLTARRELEDRLKGFQLGAEDYICKPFSPQEVSLRVQALLRRTEAARASHGGVFQAADLTLDFLCHRFHKAGKELHLSPREARLLRHLVDRQGEVVRKEELLRNVWGEDVFVELGNIEVHIRHLREKIETDPAKPVHILTVRGVGYRFVTDL